MVACEMVVCEMVACEIVAVCDRKGNSDRNRIVIIWPEREPDRHPTKLAGFLTEFGISSSVVLSNTIFCNFHRTIS